MVETDPTVALAVEGMDARAYGDYLAGRQIAVASLSMVQEDYPAKKLLLEQAVKAEKDAADVLRIVTLLTVTEGAEGENLTVARREALLVRLRQNLFDARNHFVYTKSKTLDSFMIRILTFIFCILALVEEGFATAHEVLGGGGLDDVMTAEQKKTLEAVNKRKRMEAASLRRPAPYHLPMAMAGGGRGGGYPKKSRALHPCHACG